jgi:hypothetical protein
MMIESLESRRLFAVTLPVSTYVLPLTNANSHAVAPTVTVNANAVTNAVPHLTTALSHFKAK